MKQIKRITQIAVFAPVLSLFLIFGAPMSDAQAEGEEVGTVIAVKQNGWASRLNESVKRTINEGDIVYAGDILDVKYGNHVQIALNGDRENIIHVEGNSLVQMFADGPVNAELSKGRMYAMLDNLGEANGFKISTPTAIASVRGTYYSVQTDGISSKAVTFEGAVAFAGRHADGAEGRENILIKPAQMSELSGFSQKPSEATVISQAEFEKINDIIRLLGGEKAPLSYDEALKENGLKAPVDSGSTLVKGGESDAQGLKKAKDTVVF